jgi:hypothetical protein
VKGVFLSVERLDGCIHLSRIPRVDRIAQGAKRRDLMPARFHQLDQLEACEPMRFQCGMVNDVHALASTMGKGPLFGHRFIEVAAKIAL